MTTRFCTGLWIAMLMVVLSCADDDINLTCPDPLGTDAQTINPNAISCFQPDFDGCFEFRLEGSSLNIQSVYVPYPDPDPSEAPMIVEVGEANCLGGVVQRPEEGWGYTVAAAEKHGYVFRMKDGSLGRLFINSWEKSGGEITKVNFTRQYPY